MRTGPESLCADCPIWQIDKAVQDAYINQADTHGEIDIKPANPSRRPVEIARVVDYMVRFGFNPKKAKLVGNCLTKRFVNVPGCLDNQDLGQE